MKIKRLLDIFIALMLLVLLLPVFIVVALAVWASMGRPIIFAQERPGKDEKLFRLFKFKTMKEVFDKNGQPLPDNLRLTQTGRILRSTSLDELPEIWNVLIGDMSFVGPRPLLPRYLPFYKEEERIRHQVRPGITGLSQVNGRNFLCWDKRLAMDAEYVKNWSLTNDFKILWKTFWAVIKRQDVSTDATESMLDLDLERKKSCK